MTRKMRLVPAGSDPIEVELERERDDRFTCRVEGAQLSGELILTAPGETVLRTGDRTFPVYAARVGRELHVWLDGSVYRFRTEEETAGRAGPTANGTANDIRAPMPGKIVEVHARAGAPVSAGELLVVLESMKVRFNLTSPREGIVHDVSCAPGDLVELDAVLARLEPDK